MGDCGLTGRKIIVDTYGGMARHGGGAFSGKDPSKVDRSAAYAARYVAKNIVAAGLADRCEIQVSYAIGVAQPTSISVESFGTGPSSEDKLEALVRANFDLRPYGIVKMLDLVHPMYRATAAYGHFGRTPAQMTYSWKEIIGGKRVDKSETFTAFTWERTDRAEALRRQRLKDPPPMDRRGRFRQNSTCPEERCNGPCPPGSGLGLPNGARSTRMTGWRATH